MSRARGWLYVTDGGHYENLALVEALHRQTEALVHNGYPALAGMSDDAFRAVVAPLQSRLPAEPFVLVVTSALVPLDRLIALAVLNGKPGFTTMDPDDIASFPPIAGVSLPEHNCFEMLGSRAGDKRVTGIWVSNGGPRLGWCWGGNPHSWLGMASAAGRIG